MTLAHPTPLDRLRRRRILPEATLAVLARVGVGVVVSLGLCTAAGCGTGTIGAAPSSGNPVGGNGDPGNPNPPATAGLAFTCDMSVASASTPLVRLSQTQYINTIHDIVKFALKGSEPDTMGVLNSSNVSAAMAGYPPEERAKTPNDRFGTYLRVNQDVQDAHIRATYAVAEAVGGELTTSYRMNKVFGSCAPDMIASNDADCISAFLTKFGARALRRPLTPDEIS